MSEPAVAQETIARPPPPAAPQQPEDAGVRPLPWPLWAGRHGSPAKATTVAALWAGTLALTLLIQYIGQPLTGRRNAEALLWVVQHLPWTLSVLWLLYSGSRYASALLLACALLAPAGMANEAWFSQVMGLLSFALLLGALPFSTTLRGLPAFGLFAFASFCAASVTSIAQLMDSSRNAWMNWQSNFTSQLIQDVLLTAPLAFVFGPLVESRKRQAFGLQPVLRFTPKQQLFAFPLILAVLIGFSITWMLSAEQPLSHAINRVGDSDGMRQLLESTHRDTVLRNGALVALLLGALCGGASLMILMLRQYREQLRAEITRGTEALRRRHLQLAALQQVSEATSHSLDLNDVCRQMSQTLARLTGAAQIAVYMPDEKDSTRLTLVYKECVRPPDFQHGLSLPVETSLSGKCLTSGDIISVRSGLAELVQPESLRPQFRKHGLEALVCIPILGENSTLGVASLSFDHAFEPDDDERRLFRLVGRAIGTALMRAETHERARRYAGELGGLYRFSQQLAVESDEPQILEIAASAARTLLQAQSAAVFVLAGEHERPAITCAALDSPSGEHASLRQFETNIHEPGLIGEAVREIRTKIAGSRGQSDARHVLAKGWTEHNAVIVPLPPPSADAGVPGVMVIIFPAGKVTGLEESGLAEEIARQTSAGLRRARLIQKTRQQATELRLLEQIGRTLSQRLSIASTLEQLVQNVSKIVSAKYASVFVYEPEAQLIRIKATSFTQAGVRDVAIPMTARSLVVSCIKEGRTLHAPDMYNDPRCNQELNRRFETASGVCVPLGPPGQRFGVLMVNNTMPGSFTPDDLRRLEQLGQLASAAIERAKLYEEACQRADELILLNEVGHLLVENPALESTLQRIADLVNRSFQGAGAAFLVLNRKGDALIARGVSGMHAKRLKFARVPIELADITTMAFQRNQIMQIEQAADDRRINPIVLKRLPGLVSGIVVPMSGGSGTMGVLTVWKDQQHKFLPRDLQCLGAVARLAAAAVNRDELVQAVRASEERLQELVDGLHAMIFSLDTRGNVLSFNAAAERISGLKRTEVLGHSLPQIASARGGERARIQAFINYTFAHHDCGKDLLVNWSARDGTERKIRLTSSFLHGADGKPSGLVCLGIDVTNQALLEAQLLQAQKMESVGALAGGMAHDFNNLLGGIIGQCALGRAQDSRDTVLTGCLAKIEAAAQRGADLTAKLMAFARKSVLQPRPVDIGALIQESAELLGGSLPRTIRIETKVAPGLPQVHGDATQLQQVLLNLCVNARDAMPGGGTLTIAADPAPEGGLDAQRGAMLTGGVQVEVTDTGMGMSDEVQQHLFEPFFTTKEPGKGTGLGLSVVFGIVRSHGGKISVESEVGRGTRFSIRLPAAPVRRVTTKVHSRAPESSAERKAVDTSSSWLAKAVPFGGTEKILLVDDDAMLRETTRQLLENLGYKVRVANGGMEAVKALDESFAPALVLLDVVMPGLSGLPLFKAMRTRMPQVPVVLMSGYSADKTVQSLLDAGASELIQKPFTMEALAGAIRRALEHAKTSG